ncbi:LysR family transcriptional regulator [Marinomonas posidonica]|uniref:Transcriptional regulator, LysR family n=1 Tax=Marinomonas posidonica (strain CECT 7376 / NCIMB 14433 / IVIA-Po-181) TaxID=491952 RepID=F6D0R6_MARPP|nr:LysR family transcriptional regulator [Marinomonas posidonica]AEF55948.1 transcriptional regulator, LysR family [Marinomonas posidonica IVIA-Po-181]
MFHKLPSLNSIRAFEASARLGSFKAAAIELNVTPTAISHQIRALEDELNIRLFERKTRKVMLTSEGKILAETAYQSLHGLLTKINDLKKFPNDLTVSTTNSFATKWLVPNLNLFQSLNPDINIQIRGEDDIVDIENDRRFDLAIRYGDPSQLSHKNPLISCALFTESFSLYATPNYWHTHLKEKQPIQFFATQWKNPILAPLDLDEQLLKKFPHAKVQYFNDENFTVQAALSGQGVALLGKISAEHSVKNSWLICGEDDYSLQILGHDYYLVIPQRVAHLPSVKVFKQWLLEMMQHKKITPH